MTATIAAPIDFDTPIDYRDEIRARADRIRWLTIPARRYFAIDGTEPPGSPDFQGAIGTLYPVAYALHFAMKGRGVDAPIGALQGLYWLGGVPPTSLEELRVAADARGGWQWRLLLPIPDEAASEEIEAAIRDVRVKKEPPRIDQLWLDTWEEGTVGQIIHVGP